MKWRLFKIIPQKSGDKKYLKFLKKTCYNTRLYLNLIYSAQQHNSDIKYFAQQHNSDINTENAHNGKRNKYNKEATIPLLDKEKLRNIKKKNYFTYLHTAVTKIITTHNQKALSE